MARKEVIGTMPLWLRFCLLFCKTKIVIEEPSPRVSSSGNFLGFDDGVRIFTKKFRGQIIITKIEYFSPHDFPPKHFNCRCTVLPFINDKNMGG